MALHRTVAQDKIVLHVCSPQDIEMKKKLSELVKIK